SRTRALWSPKDQSRRMCLLEPSHIFLATLILGELYDYNMCSVWFLWQESSSLWHQLAYFDIVFSCDPIMAPMKVLGIT
ncbi:MAG TPA: hypothetical protein VNY04_02205, partial [Chthoniobacterales bacterium]|nr:hypothetical protein [Chthoniobacterales bacterium]